VQQYVFQYENIHSSTTTYIPVQILFRYRIISLSTEIYIRVRKYKFQYRNICSSIELYLSTEICSRPRVEANNFADLFRGKCGCILLESYFFGPKCGDKISQVGTTRSVSSRAVTTTSTGAALYLFLLPFPISKHSESERKGRGVHSASERSPAPRRKDYKIQKSASPLA